MPIDISILCRRISPERTTLIFGAGSSIPSGGPSGDDLSKVLSEKFEIEITAPLPLSDIATIAEAKSNRRQLIDTVSQLLSPIEPMRGMLNLPDYEWASIFTTNYDEIIEKSYKKRKKALRTISSNYDFSNQSSLDDQVLFKIHGTISKDESTGHKQRMVLTAADFDQTTEYRELLYSKLTDQLLNNDAIVIGNSLQDPDLKEIIDEIIKIKKSKGAPGTIYVFSFNKDENQALVYESRGLQVCFGGIDEFFSALHSQQSPNKLLLTDSDDILDTDRRVHPATTTVSTSRAKRSGDLNKMFNGSPASYADILRGWTFERDFADKLEHQLAEGPSRIAYILGAAGSGKTTGARKCLNQLVDREILCWEHESNLSLYVDGWIKIDAELRRTKQTGVLLIDEAHQHLHEINKLVDEICKHETLALRLILISSKHHWNPRLKSPNIFAHGVLYETGSLTVREIDSLLDILQSKTEISDLVESRFTGFSRSERRNRLLERCGSDMFVCMKNIFGFESFDDIILREYGSLNSDYQETYKQVAGMQAAGIRVHRQMVIRTIGIHATQITRYLDDLDGIIEEKTISEKHGIYGWSVRHHTIAGIISKYKLSDQDEYYNLLDRTIELINPTYFIEVHSINEMCDMDRGITKINDKRKQNILLRKMISLVPQERVPRHRLIRNLIDMEEFDAANSEIRLFEKELRTDGPVQRYKVKLLLSRAKNTSGIMLEDKVSITSEAAQLAERGIDRFKDDKNLYGTYLEAGVAYYRLTKNTEIFDKAMKSANNAYDRILDPDLKRTIRVYQNIEQRFSSSL
ncbi:hypothetical protein HED22_09450 [Thalassospira sp. HF15]|uniref:SIR2 family protein n=1 Tax=Thalassospira sp. HF15 TaxID=2722755 RepID=UPI0014303125|nr:SIR2 family protein [Thalassospira sp. HF15]NIY75868.1 hypothetical protein [Thalassospira sp. HF15]